MPPADFDFPQGTIIGNWKVNDLLGRGGQGSVWSAKPVRTKRTPARALKVCFATDAQAQARFAREVELLRKCESPRVLKIFDADLDWKEHVPGAPAFAYYVAEKCKGSLEERQRDLGDARTRLDLFRQACDAVMDLHGLTDPVLHRDIKPANFLIAQELSNVVLADFGIARPLSEPALTEAFEVVGTPFYRAPEVTNGERGTIQSDVYCMGRLLEWLLTGDVSRNMATRPVPRGLDLDDEACSILDRVVTKATQAVPANRFTSIREMANQLPELWLSAKPRPQALPAVSSTDAATVLPTALDLARKNDLLGWRQLENHLRRELVDGLVSWRAENEEVWRRDKTTVFSIADKLMDVVFGRLIFSLAGVYSGNPALADQRSIIEDFLAVPGWSRAGTTAAVIEAPEAALYLVHYLHGALCLNLNRLDLAFQFVEVPVPYEPRDVGPSLWHHSDLTCWPTLFGSECTWAWGYLTGLYQKRPVLKELFALPKDFDLSLASYSMLLSLFELATDAASAKPEDISNPNNVRLTVPPMFVGMDREIIAGAARRTSGDRDVVARVAERAGAKVSTMKERWPQWKKLQMHFLRSTFDPYGRIVELPLGELA